MATLKISQLKVDTFLGVFPFEQQVKQTVLIDLSFTIDIDKAAASNALHDTVDYSALAAALTAFVESRAFLLIESMAAQIKTFLQQEFKLEQLTLKITKTGCLPNAKEVCLEMG